MPALLSYRGKWLGRVALSRGLLFSGQGNGVYASDHARGSVKNCQIHHNARAQVRRPLQVACCSTDCMMQVSLCGSANLVVESNSIFSGDDAGVAVYDSGLGHIVANDIYDNELAGVVIKTCGVCSRSGGVRLSQCPAGRPHVAGNKIHNSRQYGVLVTEDGIGLLSNNSIFDNSHAGVAIKGSAAPTFQDNVISNGQDAGVVRAV